MGSFSIPYSCFFFNFLLQYKYENTLIPERCIACGLCQTYSDLFDYHDNGIVRFYDDPNQLERDVPASEELLEAVKQCPTRALIKD